MTVDGFGAAMWEKSAQSRDSAYLDLGVRGGGNHWGAPGVGKPRTGIA